MNRNEKRQEQVWRPTTEYRRYQRRKRIVNSVLGFIGTIAFIAFLLATSWCENGGCEGTYILISIPCMILFGAAVIGYNMINGSER